MDMSQYRDLFLSETREHLRSIADLIVSLEKGGDRKETIDALFRGAHSVKGMAASMGYATLADVAHKLEGFMDRFRQGETSFTTSAADIMLEGADLMDALVNDIERGGEGAGDIAGIVTRLDSFDFEEPRQGMSETSSSSEIEIEPVATRDGPEQPKQEIPQTVRVRTGILDRLVTLTGEMVTIKNRLTAISRETENKALTESLSKLSALLRDLHSEVMLVRMLPVSAIVDRFPRMVRDLARMTGKEVSFEIAGEDQELDRGILEQMADPLIHILRNAVDHGIEPPGERVSGGKNRAGKVFLRFVRTQDHMVITIVDDGRGMDPDVLVASAVRKGLIAPEAASSLSTQDVFMLTCLPGFSTAGAVTEVSGRGVGMDAVRSTVRALGGTMTINSEKGIGSHIVLELPLSIAIIKVLMVAAGPFELGIPVASVKKTIDLSTHSIFMDSGQEWFELDDETIHLVSVASLFGVSGERDNGKRISVFISEVNGKRVGFEVDRFLRQEEVFVRPLGRPLNRLKGVVGGVVMGGGEIIFILDVATII